MFTKRNTAYKVRISELLSNDYVNREGESDYISINDRQVSRVRLMATIVNKFTNNERKSGTVIIDDGTEVISVRAWENEFHLIDNLVIGQLIDLIGRVRMYNDEVYLTPEIIKQVKPDWFVLRKLELSAEEPKEVVKNEDSELKEKLFKLIKEKGSEGALMDDLVAVAGDKIICRELLRRLIDDDLIFEPRAGRYKAV